MPFRVRIQDYVITKRERERERERERIMLAIGRDRLLSTSDEINETRFELDGKVLESFAT